MIVAAARISILIPESHSLKDKRHVVHSLLAQVRNEFALAASEVDALDRIQHAVIGLAVMSTEARHAEEMLSKAVHFLESRMFEAQMLSYETEVMHPF